MKHKHHIVPKYLGGTDKRSNLVELSVEEHAEAHRKLYEEHGNWQDFLAWQGLLKLLTTEECGLVAVKKGYQNSKASMTDREKNSRNGRLSVENKTGLFAPEHASLIKKVLQKNIEEWRGKHHTNESKCKIGDANRGKIPWNKGKLQTPETKEKIRQSVLEYNKKMRA